MNGINATSMSCVYWLITCAAQYRRNYGNKKVIIIVHFEQNLTLFNIISFFFIGGGPPNLHMRGKAPSYSPWCLQHQINILPLWCLRHKNIHTIYIYVYLIPYKIYKIYMCIHTNEKYTYIHYTCLFFIKKYTWKDGLFDEKLMYIVSPIRLIFGSTSMIP